MRTIKLCFTTLVFFLLTPVITPVFGQLVCFDFTGGDLSPHRVDLDEQLTASTTFEGVTATATAVASSGIPELNYDGDCGIGINIIDNLNDENDRLDAAVADESMEFSFDQTVTFDEIRIDGMSWGSASDYEFCDVFVNDTYVATLLDPDVDAATEALHVNPIVGDPSDEFFNLGIVLASGDVIRFSYGQASVNNGWRIEKIGVTPAPVSSEITPSSFSVFRGNTLSATLIDFEASDDVHATFNPGFTINSTEAPVWLIFDANSPSATEFSVESNAGTPGLTYTMEAFNWGSGTYDVIATQTESLNTDVVTTFALTVDHIDGGGEVRSRVGWGQTGFTINLPWEVRVDQVAWLQ